MRIQMVILSTGKTPQIGCATILEEGDSFSTIVQWFMMVSLLLSALLALWTMSRLPVSSFTTVLRPHHVHFRIVLFHDRTTHHDGFPVALGSSGTVNNVTTTGVLFHNRTTHHVGFQINVEFATNKNNVRLRMIKITMTHWSASLDHTKPDTRQVCNNVQVACPPDRDNLVTWTIRVTKLWHKPNF